MPRARPRRVQLYDQVGKRKYVNLAEADRFLGAADRFAPSVRALCYVYAYTGCRVSEALNLTRDNLDAERGTLIFRTLKRRKLAFREIPIPDWLVAMLLGLARKRGGRFWTMHRSTAWRWVKRAMTHARIRGPMTCPKGLRHGFGMKAAARSVPPNLIQRWMGHASFETTAIYLDAAGPEERSFARRMW